MAPILSRSPTAQEWFFVNVRDESGKLSPFVLRANIRSSAVQAIKYHDQDLSFQIPFSCIDSISPDFSSAASGLLITHHTPASSSPHPAPNNLLFSFPSDRKRDNFFIFVSKLCKGERKASVSDSVGGGDLDELLCTVFYSGTFIKSSLMGMKHQAHPAVVHGSDLIVWSSLENSVPDEVFDLSFAADDAGAIARVFKEGSGNCFSICTPQVKDKLYSVETAKDRDILHAALVMACSYRYIPPEHAEDVEQEFARRTSVIEKQAEEEFSLGAASGPAEGVLDKSLQKLRQKVSLNKRRFADGDFDLDLSYVLPQVIAMGFPSEGSEALYRNPMPEVKRFLASRHGLQNCRIYNLCSERSYNPQQLEPAEVVHIPFDDHNAPNFQQMVEFCTNCHQWLSRSDTNVVAVHCKAGKGRTGTMVCCYLLWLRICPSALDALAFYGQARTVDGKGVTIPSQRRAVAYFEQALKGSQVKGLPVVPSVTCTLRSIILHSCPHFDWDRGCHPFFVVTSPNSPTYNSLDDCPAAHMLPSNPSFTIDVKSQLLLTGDFRITMYNEPLITRSKHKMMASSSLMFYCGLHTSFLQQGGTKLLRDELDGPHNDKHGHYEPSFHIELVYSLKSC